MLHFRDPQWELQSDQRLWRWRWRKNLKIVTHLVTKSHFALRLRCVELVVRFENYPRRKLCLTDLLVLFHCFVIPKHLDFITARENKILLAQLITLSRSSSPTTCTAHTVIMHLDLWHSSRMFRSTTFFFTWINIIYVLCKTKSKLSDLERKLDQEIDKRRHSYLRD